MLSIVLDELNSKADSFKSTHEALCCQWQKIRVNTDGTLCKKNKFRQYLLPSDVNRAVLAENQIIFDSNNRPVTDLTVQGVAVLEVHAMIRTHENSIHCYVSSNHQLWPEVQESIQQDALTEALADQILAWI
ncbi:MAG: hypothetical protein ACRCXZ_06530 [Patescibacteria group bacterium]